MAPRTEADDDWDEDFDEHDGDDTMPCPYCGRSIHEDSVRCPHCENYLSEEDLPATPKPLWIVVTAVLVLLAVLAWILIS